MSILRQFNFLGQMRLDVPHLRSIESSIAADFDTALGRVDAGDGAYVVRGFVLSNYAAGTVASNVQLITADSIAYNPNASESGTVLWVPADRAVETLNSATNARVQGGFSAGQVNYIGIDFARAADNTTSDLVQFLGADSLIEQPETVPLARTLDYRIVISTIPFSATPNLVPLAKVLTNSQNQVDSSAGAIQDARPLFFRLGSGGDFPNQYDSFAWPQGRTEYDANVLSTLNKFTGGDKNVSSLKDSLDAIMTRIWEVGGGQNWYSPTADRNLKMTKNPSSAFTSTADNFEWVSGLYSSNHLHWAGLRVVFENANVSGVYYNLVQDQTTDDGAGSAALSKTALAVGDCIYVDLDRTQNATVTAKKAALQNLGTPTTPGSRVILAWRDANAVFGRDSSYPINTSFAPATTVAIGAVRLTDTAGTPGTPTVIALDANKTLNVGTGVNGVPTSGNPALSVTGNASSGPGALFTNTSTSTALKATAGNGNALDLSNNSLASATVKIVNSYITGAGKALDVTGNVSISGTLVANGPGTGFVLEGVTSGSSGGAAVYGFSSGSDPGVKASSFSSTASALVSSNTSGGYAGDLSSSGTITTVQITNTGTGSGLSVTTGSSSAASVVVSNSNTSGLALSVGRTSITGSGVGNAFAVNGVSSLVGNTSVTGYTTLTGSNTNPTLTVSATSGNSTTATVLINASGGGTGNPIQPGLLVNGGASGNFDGNAVDFTLNGTAIKAVGGSGTGYNGGVGVEAYGGTSSGTLGAPAFLGFGGTNASGGTFTGGAGGVGVAGVAGSGNTYGVTAKGSGTSSGLLAQSTTTTQNVIESQGYLHLTNGAASTSTSINKNVMQESTCKGWALISVTSGVATVISGINISSVTFSGSSMLVTLAGALTVSGVALTGPGGAAGHLLNGSVTTVSAVTTSGPLTMSGCYMWSNDSTPTTSVAVINAYNSSGTQQNISSISGNLYNVQIFGVQ